MAEEAVAEARAIRRAFDEARDVGEDEARAGAEIDDAEAGVKRRERIIGDLRMRGGGGGEEGGLAGIRQAYETGVRDQFQA